MMHQTFLDDRLILRLISRLDDAREGLVGYGYHPKDAEALIAIVCTRHLAGTQAAAANPGRFRATILDSLDREMLRRKTEGSA